MDCVYVTFMFECEEETLMDETTHLIHHVPVEAVQHVLPMVMLSTQCRPQLAPNRRVYWPGVLPYQKLYFALFVLLQEGLEVAEAFEREFFG